MVPTNCVYAYCICNSKAYLKIILLYKLSSILKLIPNNNFINSSNVVKWNSLKLIYL